MSIIEVQGLCKSYGSHAVLNDVSFELNQGKLVGFLGPNGAGKTTTIRILLGLIKATSGSAQIFGQSCRQRGAWIRKQVGYLPGDVHLYPSLTGLETLRFMARTRKVDCRQEILRLSSVLELDIKKRVRKFSTGMRQKLGLIQALMHRPKLLVLDEPTSALDPLVRKSVFNELRQVVNEGRTVLFSSHSLDEVEELCDEVIILRSGAVVEHQSISRLRQKALRRLEIRFAANQPLPERRPVEFQEIQATGQKLMGTWSGEINTLLDWVKSYALDDMIIERPDLNDLFIAYYSENKRA